MVSRMASLTAVLRCTWPSGDIGLDFEDLQEVRLRPVVVFSWQHPGNGESTVRIASLECPGDLVLEGFWPARAAPREGPQQGWESGPSLGGQQSHVLETESCPGKGGEPGWAHIGVLACI